MVNKYNESYIIGQYVGQNRSAASISRELGCNEKTVSQILRRNNIPTKRRIKQNLMQNLEGRDFGRLTVVRLHRIENSEYFWECKCKCGTIKPQSARSLLQLDAPVKSCGCARRKNHKWDTVPPYILSIFRAKARNRGIDFSLNLKYCDKLFQDQKGLCALSGQPIKFGRRRDVTQTTASIDRINSSMPYVEGNIQWVHKQVNIMKHCLLNSDFIDLCSMICNYNSGE